MWICCAGRFRLSSAFWRAINARLAWSAQNPSLESLLCAAFSQRREIEVVVDVEDVEGVVNAHCLNGAFCNKYRVSQKETLEAETKYSVSQNETLGKGNEYRVYQNNEYREKEMNTGGVKT